MKYGKYINFLKKCIEEKVKNNKKKRMKKQKQKVDYYICVRSLIHSV